jgi:hypothetical protein
MKTKTNAEGRHRGEIPLILARLKFSLPEI